MSVLKVRQDGVWTDLTGVSSHTHNKNEIIGLPTALPANGGNADTLDGFHASSFAMASDVEDLYGKIGDTSVSTQVANMATVIQSDLDSKVDKVAGSRLITSYEAKKLGAIVIDTNDQLAISATINADNVQGLSDLLDTKVDKVQGKGLSTNDYTNIEKDKLAEIEAGATRVIVDKGLSGSSSNPVQNKIVTEEINNLNNLIGDTPVSEQIDAATDGCITEMTAQGASIIYKKRDGTTGSIPTYVHPSYTANDTGLYKVAVDNTGHVNSTTVVSKDDITALGIPAQDTTYDVATTTIGGLMSADDKAKLNKIEDGATKVIVDSELDANSTNPVQNKVVQSAINNLSILVGDTKVSDQISDAIKDKSDVGHAHSYAGSSSIGGAATSANKLNTNAGSAMHPVYFSNGVPVETTYTLEASVPNDAKFTDTVYTHPTTSGYKHIPSGGSSGQILRWNADGAAVWDTYGVATSSYDGLMSANDKKVLDNLNVLVGDENVSDQIADAIKDKADVNHTHSASDLGADVSGSAENALKNANAYTDTKIANLINSAPTTLDTLGEIASAMKENDNVVAALDTAIGTKANASDLSAHVSNKNNPHSVTLAQLGVTATANELNCMDGVTVNVKDKFDRIDLLLGDEIVSDRIADAKDECITDLSASGAKITYKKGDGSTGSITTYVHPSYTERSNGLYKITVDSSGHVSGAIEVTKHDITALGIPSKDTTYLEATNQSSGLMSASDKFKLDSISTGANKTVVDDVLSSTSANPVQNKVVNSAISNLSTLVGDTKVSDQISSAIKNKSNVDHTHDDRYYTESEVNTKLSGKSDINHTHNYAAASHGNHVPTLESANNTRFLRNDNTWQTITPANIGAATSNHSHSDLVTLSKFNEIVGDTKVSEQISSTISGHSHDNRYYTESEVDTKLSGKSNVGHTHDDRYYTESEVNNLLANKAASSHGNHVPATQTANNAIFLRNDNTWATVTPANIGAAAVDHSHNNFVTQSKFDEIVGDSNVSVQIANAITNAKNDISSYILPSVCYDTKLPPAGTPGRIFFKKV